MMKYSKRLLFQLTALPVLLLLCSVAAWADGGIPDQMQPGSSVQISMTLRNTGSNTWSSTGDAPVRFVLRWIDAQNRVRYRWAVKWLKGTVEPGESTELQFELTAPDRSANYELMCGLVRLTPQSYDGKNYHPPATKATDQHWDGEFSTVIYNVNVVP